MLHILALSKRLWSEHVDLLANLGGLRDTAEGINDLQSLMSLFAVFLAQYLVVLLSFEQILLACELAVSFRLALI